jgi:filamentous hemagglutinin family protein
MNLNFKLSPICNVPPGANRLDFSQMTKAKAQSPMNKVQSRSAWRIFGLLTLGFGLWTCHAPANPTGMTVASGTATASQNGSQLAVTASQNAFLNWQSFNIAAGETTIFQQPSPQAIVWNRINDASPSLIYGSLQANGVVVLMNSAGFYFGPHSFVQAAGLVVSTAQNLPQNAGGAWEFNGPPPAASIINYGKINVVNGGPAFLIAENVANFGDIAAPDGTIGIAAGQDVLVSERPDGRGLSMKVTLPEGSVDNEGRLVADAGTISVNAQVVNQNGLVQANSVRDENGVIELVASDSLNLGANSRILARGDDSLSGSGGGVVTLQSGNTFSDTTGSQIDVSGGAQGGNGGNVEISAPDVLSLKSGIDAGAQPGWTAGKLVLDPYDIILDTSGSDSAGGGTVLAGDNPGDTLDLNVNSAFANLTVSEIILQAAHDITLTGGTSWNLSGTIGANNGGVTSGQLTLEAGNDIIFGDGSAIVDANNWSVSLFAGVDFTSPTLRVVPVPPGNTDPTVNHSIYLNGGDGLQNGGSIQTASGAISLTAGQDIETGGGSLQDENFNNLALASASGAISLTAGRNIQIFSQPGMGSVETTAGGGINLTAGQDIDVGTGSVSATGGGNINATATSGSLNDSGSIQTDTGSITVLAGQDVQLDASRSSIASIVTTGLWGTDSDGNPLLITSGGNINVTAVAGSVNTGANANGYLFNPSPSIYTPAPYTVSSSLGGISTAAGGDVNITAGLDIISFLPTKNNIAGDAGSGAFGPEPGNVTLTAGRNVEGHYVVADGTGTITAGSDAGTSSDQMSLSLSSTLISGSWTHINNVWTLINGVWTVSGWTVNAAQDINLQEVRNPNGILNSSAGNGSSLYYHLFDYGPDDYVGLNAGNEVHLWGDNMPRSDSVGTLATTSIYPPTLDITAGAGGVEVGNEVILFPSPDGSLEISTSGGGSLTGDLSSAVPDIIMSDSGSSQYTTQASFGAADHAAIPVHLNSPTPVTVNVSGDMNNIYLVVPEAAQINVVGDMNNSSFEGQNLHPTDVTSINVGQTAKENMENSGLLDPATDSGLYVGGDILNQNEYNSVHVSSAPDLELLNLAIGASYSDLFNNLFYDPASGELTLKGVLGQNGYNALTSLVVQAVDQSGNAEFIINPDGTETPVPETVSILDTATAALLESESQNAPPTPNPGYVLGGGGTFNITANTLDLGSTHGIQTVGPGDNQNLYKYYISTQPGYIPHGADINVTLTGMNAEGDSLDMFATTISALNGGNISVDAAGNVVVGSTYVPGDNQYARGIYTTVDGDVSVIAGGNIEVAGSRIAAYDGGGVTVESLHGNVDAGNGSSGSVTVDEYYANPVTGDPENANPTIPLSGILAMTFPPRVSTSTEPAYSVGNVIVEAPEGNITASAAGIVQLPLNGVNSDNATVTIEAGSRDADGSVLYVGNIDTSGSGVVGSTVKLDATGDITGLVFARNNADINAQLNANVTVLAEGTASVNAGGNISGTIIGLGGLSASSGGNIDASLLSQHISPGVETSGQKGFTQGTTANTASQGLANDPSTKAAASSDENPDDPRKKGKQVALAQKVSRVTVILPPKKI